MSGGDTAVRFHPLAEAFPLLEGEEFEKFVEDVRTNGQQVPIVVTPDGAVLDGRNRWQACERLGIEPRTVVWDGPEESYRTLVVSLNVIRRHLDKGRRAMAVEALARLGKGRPPGPATNEKFNQDNNLKNEQNLSIFGGDRGRKAIFVAGVDAAGVTLARLAEEHGISRAYVAHARRIHNHAPDLVPKVLSGEMKLWAALCEIKKRQDALEGHDGKPPSKPAKTKSKGGGRGGATDGGGKHGPAPPRPVQNRETAGDPWSDVKAQLAAWLVNGSRILSMLRNYPDDEVEVAGQVEEHRGDIVELLRRVVPAPRNPVRAGDGPALAAG